MLAKRPPDRDPRVLGETLRSYGSPRRSFHQHALAGDADIIDSGIPNAKLNAMRDIIAFFIGNILC